MMMDLQLCLSVCLAIVARALCCLLGSEAKFNGLDWVGVEWNGMNFDLI